MKKCETSKAKDTKERLAKKQLSKQKKEEAMETSKAVKEKYRQALLGEHRATRKTHDCSSCGRTFLTAGRRDNHQKDCSKTSDPPPAKKQKGMLSGRLNLQTAFFADVSTGGPSSGEMSMSPSGIHTSSSATTTLGDAPEPRGVGTPVEEVAYRIIDGTLKPSIQRQPMGWARKSGVVRCGKEVQIKRVEWVTLYYESQTRKGLRANEYIAEKLLKKENPDDDSMWLGYAALKSAFGKLTLARKAKVRAAAVATAAGAQAGGAQSGVQAGTQVGSQAAVQAAGAQWGDQGGAQAAGALAAGALVGGALAGGVEEGAPVEGANLESGQVGSHDEGDDGADIGEMLEYENPSHSIEEDGYTTCGSDPSEDV